MGTDSNNHRDWERWGEYDPLFAVSGGGKSRKQGDKNPWKEDEFYRSGEDHWEDYRSIWESIFINTESCLEIGCGAGRITRMLAQTFERVYALDVSPGMLEFAKKNVTEKNVEWLMVPDCKTTLPDQSLTGAFSTEVFQHFPNQEVAALYFKELGRLIKPDGSILLHIPISVIPYINKRLFTQFYRLYQVFEKGLLMLAPLKRWWRKEPYMHVRSYNFDWIKSQLEAQGFHDVRLVVYGANHLIMFVYASKKKAFELRALKEWR